MPESLSSRTTLPVLADDEPLPYYVMHPAATAPLLLVCDHASARIPAALDDLGLDAFARRCHLAVDIGAGALTEYLADSLGVTAVLAQYSRLVVDCNRALLDPTAFLAFGDGIRVPGNQGLGAAAREARAAAIYYPYHAAIEHELDRLAGIGVTPVFVSVHSFTPVLNGETRHWEVGILWEHDRGLHRHFLAGFRAAGFRTGDNEPYSGRAPADYTVDSHAEARGLPCVGIEIRQDLVADAAGIARVGNVMRRILATLPDEWAPSLATAGE